MRCALQLPNDVPAIHDGRVLVFRIGSIGDTCVAIPAFRLIRQCFATAEIRVLTNFPVGGGIKAAPLQSVIGQSSLVDGYFEYPLGLKQWRELLYCSKVLRQWRPDILVYLMPVRTRWQLIRDLIYFKVILGIRKMVGLSLDLNAQTHLWDEEKQLFESEAHRLLRNLTPLGKADLQSESVWDLGLQAEEIVGATDALKAWPCAAGYIACSIGAKRDSKEWGQDRWEKWAEEFSKDLPRDGLVLVGAAIDKERSDKVARFWRGPTLNLCGLLTPRESAEVIRRAKYFVGHDSGPLHLAAAVGTPCVAIFSAQNKPGIWFPQGKRHQVIYHKTDCFGCELDVCKRYRKKCIRSITVDEVVAVMKLALAKIDIESL